MPARFHLENGGKAAVIGVLGLMAQVGVIALAVLAALHQHTDWTFFGGAMLFLQTQAANALGFLAGSSAPDATAARAP